MASWTALDRDELSAEQLALRESQWKWFREFARTLPDPSGGEIGSWQHQDGSKSEMATLEFKLKDLDEMLADPLNPYFAWPFSEDEFRKIQIGVRDQKWVVGKMDLNGACNIVFHPVALQQVNRVSKRWPIKNGRGGFDGLGKNLFQWDRDLAARPLSALKKTRDGSGSPNPALNPTAGHPNSDEETKPTNNANGDGRSNPAASSGDPRRTQDGDQTQSKPEKYSAKLPKVNVESLPEIAMAYSKEAELERFSRQLRAIAPKDWTVERCERAFRLLGPEVAEGKE